MVRLFADIENRHRQKLVRRITVTLDSSAVHSQETVISGVKHPHRNRCHIKQGNVALLTVSQCLFGFLALGDVALHGDPVREPALGVGDGNDLHLHPELHAGFGVIDQFSPYGLPGLEGLRNPMKFGSLRIRTLQKAWRTAQRLFPAVASVPLERIVYKHNAGTGFVLGFSLGDHDDVIEPRNGGLQQHQVLTRLVLHRDVLHGSYQVFGYPIFSRCMALTADPDIAPLGRNQWKLNIPPNGILDGLSNSLAQDLLGFRFKKIDPTCQINRVPWLKLKEADQLL